MRIEWMEQDSAEWWQLKSGKIGGTRFGKVISNRKNRLIYELMNETLDGQYSIDEFISEEIQYGVDNEPIALRMYELQTGNKVQRVGAIISDYSDIHLASPDGITIDKGIVQEVKCTMNGDIHLQRIFEGVESSYLPQCINYFAVTDEIKEVHFISYCDIRSERTLHIIPLKREQFEDKISLGRKRVIQIGKELKSKLKAYRF